MSPKQFENQIGTFLGQTKEKCHHLIRKDELEEHDTPEWIDWDNSTSTDDFTAFLGAISRVVHDYEHICQ